MNMRLILALVAMLIPMAAFAAEQQVYPLRPEVNMPYQPKTTTSHKNTNTTGPSSATATATANPQINVKVYITNSSTCGGAPCPAATPRQYTRPSRSATRSGGRICTETQSLASTPYPKGKYAEPRWNARRNCCDWWVTAQR